MSNYLPPGIDPDDYDEPDDDTPAMSALEYEALYAKRMAEEMARAKMDLAEILLAVESRKCFCGQVKVRKLPMDEMEIGQGAGSTSSSKITIPPAILDAAESAIDIAQTALYLGINGEDRVRLAQAALEAANVPALADILRRIIASADECDGSDGVGVPLVSIDARLIAEAKEMLK